MARPQGRVPAFYVLSYILSAEAVHSSAAVHFPRGAHADPYTDPHVLCVAGSARVGHGVHRRYL